MRRTPIKNTGIHVPQVVFGTSAFGNLYKRTSDECRKAIVEQMLYHIDGVIALDSAGKYGAGLALETLGRTLSEFRIPNERLCISNKLGWRRSTLKSEEPTFEPGVWAGIEHDAVQDISYEGILRCWEEGNQLLGDYSCQLVSVHDPDEYLETSHSAAERSSRWNDILEAYRALTELRDAGLVQAIGVGSKDWRIARQLASECDLDWVMLANSLTIYRHERDLIDFVDSLHRQNILVINSAVFHGGFLVGSEYFDYRKLNKNNEEDRALFDWRERFHSICQRFGTAPAEACAAFGLSHPGVASIALNTSRPEKVSANLEIPNTQIDDNFWLELKAADLLDSEYPYLGVPVVNSTQIREKSKLSVD